jgi:hypothetical protein
MNQSTIHHITLVHTAHTEVTIIKTHRVVKEAKHIWMDSHVPHNAFILNTLHKE